MGALFRILALLLEFTIELMRRRTKKAAEEQPLNEIVQAQQDATAGDEQSIQNQFADWRRRGQSRPAE